MTAARTPTPAEQQWLDILMQIGCICCRRFHAVIERPEIHYMDGQTNPNAYFKTLPLCRRHLSAGEYSRDYISLQSYPYPFQRKYGSQTRLLRNVVELVGVDPITGAKVHVAGGVMARRAGMLCGEPQFHLFLDRYRTYLYETDIPDGTHNELDAKEAILRACKIRSRAMLDHDRIAQGVFLKIVAQYSMWKQLNWLEQDRPDIDKIRSRRHVPITQNEV